MKFPVQISVNAHLMEYDEEATYEGYIHLTKDEVNTLVKLIRETGATDAEAMGLQDVDEALYDKLQEQCQEIANLAAEIAYLSEGYDIEADQYHEDPEELIEECEQDGTFKFDYDEADFLDDDGQLDEDALWEAKQEAFESWVDDQRFSLEGEALRDFYYNVVGVNLDFDYCSIPEVDIVIPDQIISLAQGTPSRKH